MSLRHLTFYTAASLGLSLAIPLGTAGAQTITNQALQQAVEDWVTEHGGTTTCDPFVDEGCNSPTVPTTGGCTDCQPGDVLNLLGANNEIILVPQVELNGQTIQLRRDVNAQTLQQLHLKPQVGF